MRFLLALVALLLGFLLLRAWQVMRSGPRSRPGKLSAIPGNTRASVPAESTRRDLRWISPGEFSGLLLRHRDLIVLDLRPNHERTPLPVPPTSVRCVRTSELEEVLAELPPDRSVAFCGASAVCVFMIETSRGMKGSAPFYLLRSDRAHGEVA